VQDDDKIFHPAKLVRTYSKKQELRRCKTHRSIEMTSTHTPCKLINQRGHAKFTTNTSHDVQTRKIILLSEKPSHPNIINSSRYVRSIILGSFYPDESKRAKKMLELVIPRLFRLG
jgi:hypothetical protein